MPVELQTNPASDDIILYDVPLPLRATLFPLGFPLELATNSEAVIAAAMESWSSFPAVYPGTPISLSLAVTEHDDEPVAAAAADFARIDHLMSIVSDAHNQVICDFSRGLRRRDGSRGAWRRMRVTCGSAFLNPR